MRIKRVLAVTENEFYDHLEQEFNKDYHLATKRVNPIEKGVSYTKLEKKSQSRVTIIVEEYQRGSNYHVIFKTSYDTIDVSYKTEVTEKGLLVIFDQHIESFASSKQNLFMRLFSEGVYLGRMSDTLFNIQKEIQQNRLAID